MVYSLMGINGIKLLVMSSVLLLYSTLGTSASQSNVEALYVNNDGELIVQGNKVLSRTVFIKLGYEIYRDKEVYVSEGILSMSENDYDEAILYKGEPLLYFEIRNGLIERGVLVSSKIPVVIKTRV